MLAPDTLLHERYRISALVDQRDDSILYRAIDERNQRPVLIAALPEVGTESLGNIQSLATQIVTVAVDGLLPLHDHFAAATNYYLVAPDPGGVELDALTGPQHTPLAETEALRQTERLLAVLEVVHNRRPPLLLSDLRSSDLWFADDGSLSLAPFVLVRPIGHEPSPYRAPELLDPHHEPTTSSDLYAVGAVFYHLLTGTPPPSSRDRDHGTALVAPRTQNPQVSSLAEQMVLRALETKSPNRYQAAREMRQALATVRLMAGRPLGADKPIEPPETVSEPVPTLPAPATLTALNPVPAADPPPFVLQPPPVALPAAEPPVTAARPGGNTCLITTAVALAVTLLGICVITVALALGPWRNLLVGPFASGGAEQEQIATGVPPAADGAATAPTPGANNPPVPGVADTISAGNVTTLATTRQFSEDQVGPVAFAPDGTLLAVALDDTVLLRNAATLDAVQTLNGHTGSVTTLAFSPLSPAGQPLLLASGAFDDPIVRLWDVASAQQIRELRAHTGWIRAVVFSPDGMLLATASTDLTINIWNVASGEFVRSFSGHTEWPGNIAFSPDGSRLASTSRDGSVRLWDVNGGNQITEFAFEAPLNPATSTAYWTTGVAFDPTGTTLAIGATNDRIFLLDAATGSVQQVLEGHNNWIVLRGLAYSPDGSLLASAALDGTVRLWNPATGTVRGVLDRQGLQLLGLSWHPDGNRLAVSSDYGGEVQVWNVDQQNVVQTLRLAQGLITALDYSASGALLGTGGVNGIVRLHLLAEDRQVTLPGGAPTAQYFAFMGDDEVLVANDNGNLIIVDLANPDQPQQLDGLTGPFFSVATSADGRLIAAGNDAGQVGIWDAATREPLQQLAGLSGNVYAIAISSDNRYLAAINASAAPELAVWDLSDGSLHYVQREHSAAIMALAIQPAGRLLATTSQDNTLRLIDLQDGSLIRTIQAEPQQGWFNSAAFSTDGTLLVTGSLDGSLDFWDVGSGDRLHTLRLDTGTVIEMTFRADGAQLAVSTRDGGVTLLQQQ